MKPNFIKASILKILKNNLLMTAALSVLILAVAVLGLLPPQLIRILIDRHLVPKRSSGISELAFFYLLIVLLIGTADFLKGFFLTILGQKFIHSLRLDMFAKLERIRASYFTGNPAGFITSRFTTDIENINSLFSDGIVSMMIDCLKIAGILASIFLFSLKLGIFSLCLTPLLFALTRFFQHRMLLAQTENLEQLGTVNNHIAESIQNAKMIKLFSKESYMEELYRKRLRDNFATKQKVNFYDSCYAPAIQTIRAVTIALLVVLSAKQLGFLGISIGMIAASIELMTNLLAPIESLGMELQSIQNGISGIRRVNLFYEEAEDSPKYESLPADAPAAPDSPFMLSFEHLSFSYEKNTPVLQDINLSIRNGANITFTGRTGIGKTTLFNLIMGILEPTEGRILIGGMDAYRIPNREKRKLFGYVEQNFQFIPGSVADQISLLDTSITEEQVISACAFVGLDDYIQNLSQGYHTLIQTGGEFSQGQRQLLAIARAVAANPSILLLDEITANLDSVTEEKVVTVLKQAGLGRTILSISHRMASILDNEQVVALK